MPPNLSSSNFQDLLNLWTYQVRIETISPQATHLGHSIRSDATHGGTLLRTFHLRRKGLKTKKLFVEVSNPDPWALQFETPPLELPPLTNFYQIILKMGWWKAQLLMGFEPKSFGNFRQLPSHHNSRGLEPVDANLRSESPELPDSQSASKFGRHRSRVSRRWPTPTPTPTGPKSCTASARRRIRRGCMPRGSLSRWTSCTERWLAGSGEAERTKGPEIYIKGCFNTLRLEILWPNRS